MLRPDAVVIKGVELKPTRYHEQFIKGDRLEIDLRVALTRKELTKFQDLWLAGEPVTVARPGISAEPRQMDLGFGPWSELETGAKVELTLSDPDPSDGAPLLGPLMWNIRMTAGYARVHQEALASLRRSTCASRRTTRARARSARRRPAGKPML